MPKSAVAAVKNNVVASTGRAIALVMTLGLFATPVLAQRTGSTQQGLTRDPATTLWTHNNNVVPMCWHQLLQFPSTQAANEAKAFVARTIQDGWISLLNLKITWVDCPVSGNAKHVRVKVRVGDTDYNGTTLKVGMETLSVASQRLVPPPNDPPGLLMGARADWNQSDQTRARFRSLILHEFGHVLGFDHEQARTDGPQGVSCYKNTFSNAIPIGPADPASIMGWSYCAEALGVLTGGDIAAARSVYGRGDIIAPQSPSLLQLHAGGGIWSFTGRPCTSSACPGWEVIDRNPATESISGNYQRHTDGRIWSWDGRLRCTGDVCPGWTLIDKNPNTRAIAFGVDGLYARHANGEIWKFTGGACTANACPGWALLDRNPSTESIAVGVGSFSQSDLYQRHNDGKIWKWDGQTRCSTSACPGWMLIDRNPSTKDMAAANGSLYVRHTNGSIWVWDGQSQCTSTACPGWRLIDKNARTVAIAGGFGAFFQRHVDGKIWKWDGGQTSCSDSACPGWTLIDSNPSTRVIVAAGKTLFQHHADGSIWKWDGRSRCAGAICPGWQLLDRNPNTKSLGAADTKFDTGLH